MIKKGLPEGSPLIAAMIKKGFPKEALFSD